MNIFVPDRPQRLVIGKGVADGHVRRFEARLSVFDEPLTRFSRFFDRNSPQNRQNFSNGQTKTDNRAARSAFSGLVSDTKLTKKQRRKTPQSTPNTRAPQNYF